MKYLGCAYYPEYWGRERYETDAALMAAAGINLVRIGEFAWSRMEPQQGVYTLDWLHDCVQTMGRHGIDVLMCTPTATPPAWLTAAQPETLLQRIDGRRLEHGARRHYCYTSAQYREHTRRVVQVLSQQMARHANVVAWQIDNEPDLGETGFCHCEQCQDAFRQWLLRRYSSLEALNARWKTGFWSMDYDDWHQVRLAHAEQNPASSRMLDTRRFVSDALGSYVLMQADVIRANHPGARVSTNFNGGVFTALDYNRIFAAMDMACKDLYYDIFTQNVNAMSMDQFRAFLPGKPYWIAETGAGALDMGRPAHPAQFRAWLWSNYAHGGEAHVVFRWRTCLSGQEQELQGMLEHSGHAGHRYKAVAAAFQEMRRVSSALGELPLPKAQVAIVHEYDQMWAYQSSAVGRELDYERNFIRLHREFYRRNIAVDVIPADRGLDAYQLVVLPSPVLGNTGLAARLHAFLQAGGVVLAQGQLDMRDENDNYYGLPQASPLQALFGVRVVGGMYLFSHVAADEAMGQRRRDFAVELRGSLSGAPAGGQASVWLADVLASDCQVLLTVAEDTYAGQPAVVRRDVGRGTACYIAAWSMDEQLLSLIVEGMLERAAVSPAIHTPEYVEVMRRGDVWFVINHRDEPVDVPMIAEGHCVLGSRQPDGSVYLEPYGVAVFQKK